MRCRGVSRIDVGATKDDEEQQLRRRQWNEIL